MPEDADQDILERLVCLWPTTRSNRGPTELTCQLSWGLGWQYSFCQSFRRLFFCAGQRAFLGQLRALKGQSRTEDLVVKEIFRRIYFKVWVRFLNSLFAVVWVKPWCKPDTTK